MQKINYPIIIQNKQIIMYYFKDCNNSKLIICYVNI